jgi:hypothetical protein
MMKEVCAPDRVSISKPLRRVNRRNFVQHDPPFVAPMTMKCRVGIGSGEVGQERVLAGTLHDSGQHPSD